MKKIALTLFFIVATITYAAAQHHATPGFDREAMRQEIESLKIAHLTSQVGLTPEESTKFWPVYNKYWNERMTNKRAMHQILKEINKNGTTPDKAKEQLAQVLKLQHDEANSTDHLVQNLNPILTPEKILKVFAAEDSFKRVVIEKTKGRR